LEQLDTSLQLGKWLRCSAGRGSEESLQKIRDRHYEKAIKIFLKNDLFIESFWE
jgi:hypothetical protein